MQHRSSNRRNEVYGEESSDVNISTDFPQGFADDAPRKVKVEPRQRKRRAAVPDSSGNNRWIVSFAILTIIVIVAAYFLVSHHEEKLLNNLREDIIHDQVEPISREWEEKYATLDEENEKLKRFGNEITGYKQENEQLKHQIAEAKKKGGGDGDVNKKIDYLMKYKSKIQSDLQKMSKTLLLEKFGPGPHRVEVNLAFPPDFPKKQDSDADEAQFIIEMAPVEEMPYVVYHFLEQVSRELYNGCSFHRNAGHVVQGGPAPNFLSPPNAGLIKKFRQSGFHSILFQEYSPNFPHKKYTLGFAGRPGGPDFYVSTRDNSKLHGPGGQRSYEDPSEADACFAKVIEGFDVVDRMQLGPVKPGNYKAFEKNIAVKSMRIIKES